MQQRKNVYINNKTMGGTIKSTKGCNANISEEHQGDSKDGQNMPASLEKIKE